MKTKKLSALHKIIAVISIIASLAVVVLAIFNCFRSRESVACVMSNPFSLRIFRSCSWLPTFSLEMMMRMAARFVVVDGKRQFFMKADEFVFHRELQDCS